MSKGKLKNTFVLPSRGFWYCYFLELEGDFYYVGITKNPIRRMEEHNAGKGAVFTSKHHPIKLKSLWKLGEMTYEEAGVIEDEFTKLLIKRWGKTVRGGRWAYKLSDRMYRSIIKEKNTFSPSAMYEEATFEYSFGSEEKPLQDCQKHKKHKGNLRAKQRQNQITKKIKSRKGSKKKRKHKQISPIKEKKKTKVASLVIKTVRGIGYRAKL